MNDYIAVGLILLAFEVGYLTIAKKTGIVDTPHLQSSHTGKIIRGGGIIFYLAYLLWFVLCDYQYPMIFVGLSIIAIISFVDDIHSINPRIRLILQFVAIIAMLYDNYVFNLPLQPLLLLSVACVGTINIYNFMDGINGMTGGYSLVVLISLLCVNNYYLEFIDSSLIVYFIIADVIFCFFNFRKKAVCFAGDVGSLTMGFVIIFLLIKLIFKAGHMHWIAFMAVYLVDGGLTIIHRIILKENILMPHKKHAYQIMTNEFGLSHIKVSCIYIALQAICCIWIMANPINSTLIIQFVILFIIYVKVMQKYYFLHFDHRK